MRKMYDVLKSDEIYEYLDDVAVKELIRIRIQAKESKVTDFIYESNGLIIIHPWLGTVQFRTLLSVLDTFDSVKKVRSLEPYKIIVETDDTAEELLDKIKTFNIDTYPNKDDFATNLGSIVSHHKYSNFVPIELIKSMHFSDRLDFNFEF